MGATVFELALLLSLKDAASGGLDRIQDKLRATGKEGKATLKTFEELRSSMKRDLAIGGVGLTMLALMKKGVDSAAEYETSILDLKSAYQEVSAAGGRSSAEQAADLNQLEQLAVRLGNNLQGSTGDYIGILSSLRKAGIDTETVLGGAGEAAANLANVSGALMRGMANEQAKELGQYGKMFKLRPDDFIKSVDLFSAAKDRFGIESSSLIESAKYFQATAGSLKITGFTGAEETVKMFALLKRQGGLEGSMAGTGMRTFFTQIVSEKKKIEALKKEEGIDLSQMFDAKGEFRGYENALKVMEQFRKLSPQMRAAKLNDIFGERGGEVAGAMVDAGVEGWRSINAEIAKAVPVTQKITAQMETYRAKMEALLGTLTNISAVTFTPMLNTVKPLLDVTNSIAGWTQEFAQAHPTIAGVTTDVFGLTGASLALAGGIKAATTGITLWRIASMALSTSLVGAGDKATGLKGKLGALSSMSTMKLTVGIAAVGAGVEIISWMMEEIKKNEQRVNERKAVATGSYDESLRKGKLYTSRTEAEKNKEMLDTSARQAFEFIRVLPSFQHGIQPESTQGGKFSINLTGADIKQSNLALADPNVLARLIRLLDKGQLQFEGGKTIAPDESQRIKEMLSSAYPEQFKVAMQIAAEDLVQSMTSLKEPIEGAVNNFNELLHPTDKLPFQLGQVGNAAVNLSNRLNNIQPTLNFGTDNFFGNYRGGGSAPTPQSGAPFTFSIPPAPSSAPTKKASLTGEIGGGVSRDLQAAVFRNSTGAGRRGETHITVNVNGATINDADALAGKIAAKVDAVLARVDEHEEILYDWRHYDRMVGKAFDKGKAHA